MDADVLYDSRLLQRLRQTSIGNCFLLDRMFEPGPEPVKLCVQAGRLVEFRKQLPEGLTYDFAGESVGFFRFSGEMIDRLFTHVQQYIATGQNEAPYEEAIRDLLLQSPEAFGYEDITGLPWIEIDFPEDIDRAQLQILPQLQLLHNDP
jgi:choline kinase